MHATPPPLNPVTSLFRRSAVATLLIVAPLASFANDLFVMRGGENDPDATAGSTVEATRAAPGGYDILFIGSPGTVYSADTAVPGSTLSLSLNGNSGLSNSGLFFNDIGSSFGMELWFKAASVSGPQALFYNGDTSAFGLGLYLFNGTLQALRGGVAFNASSVTPQAGVWQHAALVWDGGQGRLFLNGAMTALFSGFINDGLVDDQYEDFTPYYEEGRISLGSNGLGGDQFTGLLDEVRFFSFASGTFTPAMLNYSPIPEPSAFAALFGAAALTLAATRRRRK